MDQDLLRLLHTEKINQFSEKEFFAGTSLYKALSKQAELDLELETVQSKLKTPVSASAKKADTHTVTKVPASDGAKQMGPPAPQVQGNK